MNLKKRMILPTKSQKKSKDVESETQTTEEEAEEKEETVKREKFKGIQEHFMKKQSDREAEVKKDDSNSKAHD